MSKNNSKCQFFFGFMRRKYRTNEADNPRKIITPTTPISAVNNSAVLCAG